MAHHNRCTTAATVDGFVGGFGCLTCHHGQHPCVPGITTTLLPVVECAAFACTFFPWCLESRLISCGASTSRLALYACSILSGEGMGMLHAHNFKAKGAVNRRVYTGPWTAVYTRVRGGPFDRSVYSPVHGPVYRPLELVHLLDTRTPKTGTLCPASAALAVVCAFGSFQVLMPAQLQLSWHQGVE
jgi:hypothetical protein